MNTLVRFATLAALASLAACTTHRVTREVVREQPIVQNVAPERERVVIVQPPAAPVETVPPAPSTAGYTWVPGHYVWQDGRWEWRTGQWMAGSVRPLPPVRQEAPTAQPHPSARWVPGHWTLAGNDWVWVRGQWL